MFRKHPCVKVCSTCSQHKETRKRLKPRLDVNVFALIQKHKVEITKGFYHTSKQNELIHELVVSVYEEKKQRNSLEELSCSQNGKGTSFVIPKKLYHRKLKSYL